MKAKKPGGNYKAVFKPVRVIIRIITPGFEFLSDFFTAISIFKPAILKLAVSVRRDFLICFISKGPAE